MPNNKPKKRGPKPKAPADVGKTFSIRAPLAERRAAEIAAIKHGFVTSKGKPRLGPWLLHASKVADAAN